MKFKRKAVGVAIILAFIIFVAVSIATDFEWWICLRFQLGFIPFEKPGSMEIATGFSNGEESRPIGLDRYKLKVMDFIASIAEGEEPEVILEGKHSEVNTNSTLPRFEMGWLNPAWINFFGTEYNVCRLEMWVTQWIKNETYCGFSPKALYLNIRFRSPDYLVEKVFLIEDPELAMDAFRLMVETYQDAGGH